MPFGSGINFYGGPGGSAHKQYLKYQDREHSAESVSLHSRLHFNTLMLASSHAVHDCQIRSNLYKLSGNTGTDFYCTETKGEVVIEMSGKYDFTVTHEVIEMMEAESKVIVNWSYDYQIVKESSDKYNLNKDYVKVLHKR